MGVLNITPDSFSDGGRYLRPDAAVAQAQAMAAAGADIIDIGGESTRPGAPAVDEAEEIARVVPVIEALATRVPSLLSIDTSKPAASEEPFTLSLARSTVPSGSSPIRPTGPAWW